MDFHLVRMVFQVCARNLSKLKYARVYVCSATKFIYISPSIEWAWDMCVCDGFYSSGKMKIANICLALVANYQNSRGSSIIDTQHQYFIINLTHFGWHISFSNHPNIWFISKLDTNSPVDVFVFLSPLSCFSASDGERTPFFLHIQFYECELKA